MEEMATSENVELISRVYTQALENREHGRNLDAADLMVYHVEMLSQEVNSGASFEQYFRWASCEEISEAAGRLKLLGLDDIAGIVRRAIKVAFPAGMPSDDEQKDELTDWTEDQEQRLSALFEEFEEFNGRIMNVLAAYYRSAKS